MTSPDGSRTQYPHAQFASAPLLVTKEDLKEVVSGLDGPVGDQIFNNIWLALSNSDANSSLRSTLCFSVAPFKITKDTLRTVMGGLGDSSGGLGFDTLWSALVVRARGLDHESAIQNCAEKQVHAPAIIEDCNMVDNTPKKRKAASDHAESSADSDAHPKKLKTTSDVDDSQSDNGNEGVLPLRVRKTNLHRADKASKKRERAAGEEKADQFGKVQAAPIGQLLALTQRPATTTEELASTSSPPPKASWLPQISNPTFANAWAWLQRIDKALRPYEYKHFTEEEIAHDEALYSKTPMPPPKPVAFFGSEEEKRLRKMFPAFEPDPALEMPEDKLARFEASTEGKVPRVLENLARGYEKARWEGGWHRFCLDVLRN